jgi:hypothetical protein
MALRGIRSDNNDEMIRCSSGKCTLDNNETKVIVTGYNFVIKCTWNWGCGVRGLGSTL